MKTANPRISDNDIRKKLKEQSYDIYHLPDIGDTPRATSGSGRDSMPIPLIWSVERDSCRGPQQPTACECDFLIT